MSSQQILASVLPLVGVLVGPRTHVQTRKSFTHSLSVFTYAVSAPGGGKSAVLTEVIDPVISELEKDVGHNLAIETYSLAGLQEHLASNKGYAYIYTDEGARVMAQISQRQKNNEAEISLLCKLWSGRGDFTKLRDQTRGTTEVSVGMCLFVQPEPFLRELKNLNSHGDGYMDRFLLFTTLPYMHDPSVMDEYSEKIKEYPEKCINNALRGIFQAHLKTPTLYTLSEAAQKYFDAKQREYNKLFNAEFHPGEQGRYPHK